jgi:hypothetical protein
MEHGISVRERKTNKLVEFIKCETGRPALNILKGIRINMGSDYKATEEMIDPEEVNKLKNEN